MRRTPWCGLNRDQFDLLSPSTTCELCPSSNASCTERCEHVLWSNKLQQKINGFTRFIYYLKFVSVFVSLPQHPIATNLLYGFRKMERSIDYLNNSITICLLNINEIFIIPYYMLNFLIFF